MTLELEIQDESYEAMPGYAVTAFGGARTALWDANRAEGLVHVALITGESKCIEIDGKPNRPRPEEDHT